MSRRFRRWAGALECGSARRKQSGEASPRCPPRQADSTTAVDYPNAHLRSRSVGGRVVPASREFHASPVRALVAAATSRAKTQARSQFAPAGADRKRCRSFLNAAAFSRVCTVIARPLPSLFWFSPAQFRALRTSKVAGQGGRASVMSVAARCAVTRRNALIIKAARKGRTDLRPECGSALMGDCRSEPLGRGCNELVRRCVSGPWQSSCYT